MASQKPISKFGAVAANGNGWRTRIQIGDRKVDGPQRATRAEAQVDLDAARQCESRDAMSKFLTSLVLELRASTGVTRPPGGGLYPAESKGSGDSSVEKLAVGAQAVIHYAKASSNNTRSGFAQPRAKKARVANEGRSSGGSHSAAVSDDQKVLLLQLKREFYNAIKSRRKQWEARPLFNDKNKGPGPSLCNKLAIVGRAVVLQSGACTNDRVRIAEVRRYDSVQDMVAELAAGLIPDLADARSRVEAYESLYGPDACARGFVAMRLEWPNEAAAATTSKGTSGSNVRITSTSSVSDAAPLPTADRTCTSPIGCGQIFCVQCHP